MENCIFCKIINGDIPSETVYEDESILVFKDLEPQAPTHLLFIPKEHISSANDVTAENSNVIAHIFETIPQVFKKLNLGTDYRIVNNCGESAGQSVHHIHFHVMGGRNFSWPAG